MSGRDNPFKLVNPTPSDYQRIIDTLETLLMGALRMPCPKCKRSMLRVIALQCWRPQSSPIGVRCPACALAIEFPCLQWSDIEADGFSLRDLISGEYKRYRDGLASN